MDLIFKKFYSSKFGKCSHSCFDTLYFLSFFLPFLQLVIITKTRLYYFDPLKPHFYIVKLGFTGVYIIFLIFAQKHRLWVLVKTASQKYEKYQNFLSENFPSLVVKVSIYLNRRVFVMCSTITHSRFCRRTIKQ